MIHHFINHLANCIYITSCRKTTLYILAKVLCDYFYQIEKIDVIYT